eukprot:TRINITY_DN87519_c0_g1_i1.p1 TRINITY_DN87519_c0_g1~~TRINITY_DN87519_c0_g1_i1.p1  ORF type:complete len:275 (-),score=41.07 TRINITY_DN87519_c0_g1_i1:81-905(-)
MVLQNGLSTVAVNEVAGPLTGMPELPPKHNAISGPNRIRLPLKRDSGKLAFTLENVLTPEECEHIIRAAETFGFGVAGLGSSGRQEVSAGLRDSSRIITDDAVLATQIFRRIRKHLPRVWQGRRLLGLNEQLKLLRYHPGQKFVAHYDGAFCRPKTPNKTCLTVQLYLSASGVSGGSTRFIGPDASSGVSCLPYQGRALVFQHTILHEGAEVHEGIKYTLRTDVEYSGESMPAVLQECLGLGGSTVQLKQRLLAVATLITAVGAALMAARTKKT